jgi:hypothetical protein
MQQFAPVAAIRNSRATVQHHPIKKTVGWYPAAFFVEKGFIN